MRLIHSCAPLAAATLLLLSPWQADGQAPQSGSERLLRTAIEVARYPDNTSENQPFVALEAVVTFMDSSTVFIQDDTGSTFLNFSRRQRTTGLQPGQRLKITGRRYPGLYIGGIQPDQVTKLHDGPVPQAIPLTREQIGSGIFHYRLATIEGVVRSFDATGEASGVLTLNTTGGTVDVRVDQNPDDPAALIDAEVRVQGLVAGTINNQRQLVHPYLRCRGPSEITVLKPAPQDAFAPAPVSISDLSQAGLHRIKIRGIALGPYLAGGIFIRDQQHSIFAQTLYPVEVSAGDVVEIVGFAETGTYSARLTQAECLVVDKTTPPAPLNITSAQQINERDAALISLRATVLQRLDQARSSELHVQLEDKALRIISQRDLDADIKAGSLIEVTGLCQVTSTRSRGYRAEVETCDILLRSNEDVRLLTRAPWWTAERLVLVLLLVGSVALFAVAWAAILRKQITRQMALIESKLQREAVTEERQRIAREFHDTLEQDLAGLSIRLDAALPRVEDDKASSLLTQLRSLLVRLQTEAREMVWDLRDSSRSEAPLDKALSTLLEYLQVNTTARLQLSCQSPLPVLPPLAQHHLLRITREAVNNALKHGSPQTVQVTVTADEQQLVLRIQDDGAGFDIATSGQKGGHFGLQGMRERAKKLDASINLESQPGAGTTLEIVLALSTQSA